MPDKEYDYNFKLRQQMYNFQSPGFIKSVY